MFGGGGESRKLAVVVLGVHTTSKNPAQVSWMQAYTAYLERPGMDHVLPIKGSPMARLNTLTDGFD
jgi:hypothetical protein